MDRSIRRKLEAMGRVRDFLRVHPFDDSSHTALAARFEAMLVRANGLSVEEQTGRLEVRTATKFRKELRRELHTELIRYVARVGAVAAHEEPELLGRFRAPGLNASNATFLARAWDMLNLAREHQELLGNHGLAGHQIEDLATGLTRYESATERANAGLRTHVGCRSELTRIAGKLTELVGLLDPLYRRRFKNDAQALASWDSARTVAGSSRSKPAETEQEPVAEVAEGASGSEDAPPSPPAGSNLGRAA